MYIEIIENAVLRVRRASQKYIKRSLARSKLLHHLSTTFATPQPTIHLYIHLIFRSANETIYQSINMKVLIIAAVATAVLAAPAQIEKKGYIPHDFV